MRLGRLLGHGSGGKLSADLVREVFLPAFKNSALAELNDQALVNIAGTRLAFSTDSFVVKPLFFPGGDIGAHERSLAVRIELRDDEATLTEERIDPIIAGIVDRLHRTLGARLRG